MEVVGDGDPHLGENHATVDGHHAFVAGQDDVNPGFDGILWRASNALCAPVTLGSFAAVFVASLGAGGSARVGAVP